MLLTQQKWHQKKYFRRIIKSSRPRSKTPRGNYIDCLFEYQFNLWSQNTHPLHTDDPSTSQHAWSRSSSHWETMNQHTTLVTATCPRSEETCAESTSSTYSGTHYFNAKYWQVCRSDARVHQKYGRRQIVNDRASIQAPTTAHTTYLLCLLPCLCLHGKHRGQYA